jgi:hypothetical protein
LDVAVTTRLVIERAIRDPVWRNLISTLRYNTLHYDQVKGVPFDYRTDLPQLLERLADEPRAHVVVYDRKESSKFSLNLFMNCEDEVVKVKVDGRKRSVMKASDSSYASIDVEGETYLAPERIASYLRLMADGFDLIGGEYGWAMHHSISPWETDYDRVRGTHFEPKAIVWANFFGPELVERLGRDRFRTAPVHERIDLRGGGIVVTVCGHPLEELQAEVQERIVRVKKHLGVMTPRDRARPEEIAAFENKARAAEQEMGRCAAEAFRSAREETAGEMARQATGCVEGAWQFWKAKLDYSPASTEIVDRLILSSFKRDEDEETIAGAVQAFGAYLGECIRRTQGGTWHDEEMKGQPVLLGVGPDKHRVDPFKLVRTRFEQRENGQPLAVPVG